MLYTCDQLIFLKMKWLMTRELFVKTRRHLFPCHKECASEALEEIVLESDIKTSVFLSKNETLDDPLILKQLTLLETLYLYLQTLLSRHVSLCELKHLVDQHSWKTLCLVDLKRQMLVLDE